MDVVCDDDTDDAAADDDDDCGNVQRNCQIFMHQSTFLRACISKLCSTGMR